ncbi:MAG: glycosyltransferase [Acidobacteriota bacterium]|nr:glycosyltransferase [Acidobacteriota bacterium]
MSRIAVVTSSPPFVEGGHLVIARALVEALRAAGHQAGVVVTPQNRFGRQAAAYVATWLTDVGQSPDGPIDQVISLRYPSYAVRHPRHVCWLNHTMREYYDQWPRFRATLSWKAGVKEQVRRRLIHAADGHLLRRHVTRLFVQSETIRQRVDRWLHVPSEVLYPPPPPRPYRCDGYGDYLFAVSRLTRLKRFDLLVRALAEPAAAGVRCVIAGDGEEAPRLQALIGELGLGDRVQLIGRIDDAAMLDHLARCRAVCFPPLDEDYGFVTVEAFAARKAVVTCRDSGGPAELVEDGRSGFVCEPAPAKLAAALGTLAGDRATAERLGAGAAARVADLTWERAIGTLLLV